MHVSFVPSTSWVICAMGGPLAGPGTIIKEPQLTWGTQAVGIAQEMHHLWQAHQQTRALHGC